MKSLNILAALATATLLIGCNQTAEAPAADVAPVVEAPAEAPPAEGAPPAEEVPPAEVPAEGAPVDAAPPAEAPAQ